jgi:hypothetical protein
MDRQQSQKYNMLMEADCNDLHQIEENHKIPQAKTKMGFREAISSTTGSTR